MPKKPPIVFFSWQSDTAPARNRDFIEESLIEAIGNLQKDIALEPADRELTFDKDTQGVAGSPPIAQTIFEKIESCVAFVADLTFVGESLPNIREQAKRRLIPNPNVLVEHGYALRSRSHSRLIGVMNAAFGPCDETTLPFDLRHLRWPITYRLESGQEKAPVKAKLVQQLTDALKAIILLGGTEMEQPLRIAVAGFRDALEQGRPNSGIIVDKAFDLILAECAKHRLQPDHTRPLDELFIESLQAFVPLRDAFLEICDTWIRADDVGQFVAKVVSFLERVRELAYPPQSASGWDERRGDNFGFFSHELFLSVVAIILKRWRFDILIEFLSAQFVLRNPDNPRESETGYFEILYDYSQLLAERNNRLNQRFISPQGMLLLKRAETDFVGKDWVQQADLFCATAILILRPTHRWWPHTLLWDHRVRFRSEVFQRAESRAFYDKLKPIWGGLDADQFRDTFEKAIEEHGRHLLADHTRPNWEVWLNLAKLGTKP